jgi:hypothetical protein
VELLNLLFVWLYQRKNSHLSCLFLYMKCIDLLLLILLLERESISQSSFVNARPSMNESSSNPIGSGSSLEKDDDPCSGLDHRFGHNQLSEL